MQFPRRQLSLDESRILSLIQELYGDMNTVEEVFFSKGNEAVIFVKDPDGTTPIAVNLTTIAYLYKNGTSIDEIKRDWLISRSDTFDQN